MVRRAIAIINNFGFRGSYWEKGQITELGVGEKVPEYFRLLDKKEEQENNAQHSEDTLADVAIQDLIVEAIGRGIKDAKILNQDELLEVLARETKPERIEEIIKKAKARKNK